MTDWLADALGLPAVYVPLPIGNGEQELNAADVIAAGGGLLVKDADLTPTWVTATLIPLLGDTARVEAMAAALTAAGGPVLAFCRSGTRSAHLWALARARLHDDPGVLVAKAAAAGYDIGGIRAMLDTLAASRPAA